MFVDSFSAQRKTKEDEKEFFCVETSIASVFSWMQSNERHVQPKLIGQAAAETSKTYLESTNDCLRYNFNFKSIKLRLICL